MKRVLGCLFLAAAALASETPQELFEKGLVKERSEGHLKEAIQLYERAAEAAGKDRALAAKAFLEAGECHSKLGDAEARKLFERVIREYSDQKEAVALARTKLGKEPGIRDSRVSFRQVWNVPDQADLLGAVSRDGRYIPYVDWADHGNLFVHDFALDANRRLTDTANDHLPGPKVWQAADGDATFSRDVKQLVYSWGRGNREELRLMDMRKDGIPQSRLLFDNPDIRDVSPRDWSPDGKSIAVKIRRFDKTGQIGVVTVADGVLHVLKSVDWRGPTTLVFSPDGKYLAYDLPAGDNTEQRDIFVIATDASREIPAVVSPSQEAVVGWSNDGKRLLFTSDRGGSMGLWSVRFLDGKVEGQPELLRAAIGQISTAGMTDSGRLYAGVDESFWAGDVYVASIDSVAGKPQSPPSLAAQTYVGRNLSPGWSHDGKYLAYSSRRGSSSGSSYFVIAIRSAQGGEVREVTPSPGLDLLGTLVWAPDDHSLVVQARDMKGRYGIFRVDAQTGQTSILRTQEEEGKNITLAGISADGRKLYYGRWDVSERNLVWIERDLAGGSETELGLEHYDMASRPSRPALSPDGRYLLGGGATTVFVVPTAGGKVREVAHEKPPLRPLGWAADGRAVYAASSSGELWLLPIDGGERRKLDLNWDANNQKIYMLHPHPDGHRIVFGTRPAKESHEIWVLENFLPTVMARKK